MSDLLWLLAELNAALAGAVVVVLVLRRPFRKTLGPRAAYSLWAAVPAGMAAVCLPRAGPAIDALAAPQSASLTTAMLTVWLVGAIASAGLMLAAQARFAAQARQGLAGPAVTGVIIGRLVMPADSAARWSAEEEAAIRAHERAHVDRGDLRVNAAAAVLQCLFWCNPLTHIGVSRFRFDQELACDATVMAMRPGRRRVYAEALLKAAPPRLLALGCGWGAAGVGALETRLTSLRLPCHPAGPGAIVAVLGIVLATTGAGWILQPATPEQLRPVLPSVLILRLQAPSQPPTP